MQQVSLWQSYDGALKCAVKDPITGKIWGCNAQNTIFHRDQGQPWVQIDGLLVQLTSVNNTVYGVNSQDEVFYREFNKTWVKMDGLLKHIAVDKNGHIVGVNAQQEVFYRAGVQAAWQKLDGALVQVDIANGLIVGVNQNGDIWKKNGPNGQWTQVHCEPVMYASVDYDGSIAAITKQFKIVVLRPNRNWVQVDGEMKQLHFKNDILMGTNKQDGIFSRKIGMLWSELSNVTFKCVSYDPTTQEIWGCNQANEIFYKKINDVNWTKSDGLLVQLCAINNTVYGVNSNKEVFFKQNKGQWQKLDGALKHVAADKNGMIIGVNDQDQIWYKQNPQDQWHSIDGLLKVIDISNGVIVGCNSANEVFKRVGVNGAWQKLPGALKQASIDQDGTILGANANDEVYQMKPNSNWEKIEKSLSYVQLKEKKVVGVDRFSKVFFTEF